jgi:adenosylcobinamide-GDP ribazoletransferase
VFNRSIRSNKTLKGAGVHKNDTKPFLLWDVPLALVLLTRLPLPRLPDTVFARQAQAAWAFPLVGLVVGLLACCAGWAAQSAGLPPLASAGLVVAVLICITGAMHEDGLADSFDGLWGGFTPERRMEIMRDSHIGTYGVLALLLSQLIRVSAIAALLTSGAVWTILAACVFSRATMPVLMKVLPNARQSGLSHSVGIPGFCSVFTSMGLAALIALLSIGAHAVIPAICAGLIVGVIALVAKAKIGGQTGDILGAAQQLAEITFLLALTAQL